MSVCVYLPPCLCVYMCVCVCVFGKISLRNTAQTAQVKQDCGLTLLTRGLKSLNTLKDEKHALPVEECKYRKKNHKTSN